MRTVFFGHARYSVPLLRRLYQHPDVALAGIVTRRASRQNHDFQGLASLAAELGVPCLEVDALPASEWPDWLTALRPDAGFVIGWSTILTRATLDVFPAGVIGYHPSALPRNRGHHPIIWPIVLGLGQTASTLFMLDEGVDSGDIVSQVPVAITPDDDAGTLYERLTTVVGEQLVEVTRDLARGRLRRVPQDPRLATTWRKRGPADGRIDWRMSAAGIHNLIRALTRPYVGAHFDVAGQEVKVWRSRLGTNADEWCDREPGRVLAVEGGTLVVKCGDGPLQLTEHELMTPLRVGMSL
jgi:methionyl-tRNA formyltransferase